MAKGLCNPGRGSSDKVSLKGREPFRRALLQFANLTENAAKFNRQNGRVTLSADRCDGQARILIEDTGYGIEDSEAEQIFERFYRGGGGDATEGTGLGLSIAKTIIEAHGGSIGVQSRPGEGSSFTIMLPLTEP